MYVSPVNAEEPEMATAKRGGAAKRARAKVKPKAKARAKKSSAKRVKATAKTARRGSPRVAVAAVVAKPQKARRQPESLRLRSFSPGFTVADLSKSVAFYTKTLGFIVAERWVREGALRGVMLKAGACEIGLSQDDWAKGRERRKGEGVRLWCETKQDVDALAARLRTAGAANVVGPKDQSWGVRSVAFDDLDGYHLTIYRMLA